MTQLLPFIVAGLATGSIYGLAATGLVLTYKTSGIFNFGYGALATIGAYVFYALFVDLGLDWPVAMAIAVLVVGPLMGLVMEFISRSLAPQRTAWKVVGTVGLILLVQGAGTLLYGADTLIVPQFLPGTLTIVQILGVKVRLSQILVAAAALVIVVILYVVFRFTRFGVRLRAVVQNPELTDLQGVNPVMIRRAAWIIGCSFASLSGILLLPIVGLDPLLLTFLIVQSFAAAAIGRFSSIPVTFVGALAIGLAESILLRYEVALPDLAGVSRALPFVILILIMLVTPRSKLVPATVSENRPALQWHGPTKMRIAAYILVVGALATVPLWASSRMLVPYWASALTTTLIMLSLGLLVRTAGIVSLCTAAFAAIGAVAFSQFAVEAGMPWLLAVLLAGVVAVPIGALVAIPAIRLSGLFVALATLGFGLLVERFLYKQDFMFGPLAAGRAMPRPGFALSDQAFYYLLLGFVVVALVVFAAIQRGRLGRMLLGMSEAPRAVTTLGLSPRMTRVLVFCIAASVAAIAGALNGAMFGRAQATSTFYSSFNSLVLIVVLSLVPFRAPWFAILAGVTVIVPGLVTGESTPYVMNILFGVFAIMTAMAGGPPTMPMRLRRFFEARFGDKKKTGAGPSEEPASAQAVVTHRTHQGAGLEVSGLEVRFGGLVAVRDIDLHAPLGQVTGLIGPNGAGKTTTFNACSGLNKPVKGTVSLNGESLTGHSPHQRARAGLGRTFQIMELCESLTVAENVALGREASQAGSGIITQFFASPHERALRSAATTEAMRLCGIEHLAHRQAGSLSTGERRLVELARALAGPFDVLLLDEPSSGLDSSETQEFAAILRHVVKERGVGILLVEHDVALVLDLCAYIYVMDSGQMLFHGTPADVRDSREVQEAYLGEQRPSAESSQDHLHQTTQGVES